MAKNTGLSEAKRNKNDEFYTQLEDINNELMHYKDHFKGKTVLCNCDDPYESNFFKYFALNFYHLGLKKLITTSYVPSPVAGTQLSFDEIEGLQNAYEKQPFRIEINEVPDFDKNGAIDLDDIASLLKHDSNTTSLLLGDERYPAGDFRSKECIELLEESDIVVTNPPFSLFREFVAQLMEHKKLFLIIGNVNATTFKEFFPYLQENRVWLGPSISSGDREFRVPEHYPLQAAGYRIDDQGHKFIRVKGVRWFTNLDHKKRHEELILYKKYSSDKYPTYDNYDAIEVSKVAEIPADYGGVMGVPITFLDKYNPDQYEIVGMAKRGAGDPALKSKVYTKIDYPNYSDLNATPVLIENGIPRNTYPRILIRRKDRS